MRCVHDIFQEVESDEEKVSWSWLPEAELCLPIHDRNVANYKKVRI